MKMILIFILTPLLTACNNNSRSAETTLLDCLVETFIRNYPPGANDVVFISESQAWTDSLTLFIISHHSRSYLSMESADIQTEVKGNTVLYTFYDIQKPDGKTDMRFPMADRINSSFNWKDFDTENLPSEEDMFIPPYDPLSIQVVIDNQNQCIDNMLWANTFFEAACQFCHR